MVPVAPTRRLYGKQQPAISAASTKDGKLGRSGKKFAKACRKQKDRNTEKNKMTQSARATQSELVPRAIHGSALSLQGKWMQKVLSGAKSLELRTCNCHVQGVVLLLQSVSSTLMGAIRCLRLLGRNFAMSILIFRPGQA